MATSSKESQESSPSKEDKPYELTLDEMVNDFDDERTLEEEEKLAADDGIEPSIELSNLQKEAELPIEQLLAIYNCTATIPPTITLQGGYIDEEENDEDSGQKRRRPRRKRRAVKVDIPNIDLPLPINDESVSGTSTSNKKAASVSDNEKEEDQEPLSELRKLYPETYQHSIQAESLEVHKQLSENEEDSPDEDEYKKIMVGSEFQAKIPSGLCKYGDVLPYENEDKLLWDPTKLSEDTTEEYLHKSMLASSSLASAVPLGKHLRDDEESLFLLLSTGFCVEEAHRRSVNLAAKNTMSVTIMWSEEECRNFETGLRIYGKNFHLIQKSKVKTRSVGELVQFYYLWKKTERHDAFANKARLEKKKYSLDPGLTTDYMERFLEEQENNGSSHHGSPSILGNRQRHDSGSSGKYDKESDGAAYCQSQSLKALKASSDILKDDKNTKPTNNL